MPDKLPVNVSGSTQPGRSTPARGYRRPEPVDPALAPFDLREFFAVLRRHLGLVFGTTAIAVGIAAYLVYASPPAYRANAVIRLADARQALTGGLVGGAEVGQVGRSVDPLLSQLEVLRSRAILGAVVDSLPVLRVAPRGFSDWVLRDVRFTSATARPDSVQLAFGPDSVAVRGRAGERHVAYGAPAEMDGLRFAVAERPRMKGLRLPLRERPREERGTLYVVDRERAVSALLTGLRVTPRPNTDVIDVAYTAGDPRRAQQVVNLVVGTFQMSSAHAAGQQARLHRKFIEDQLHDADSALAVARGALGAFRSRQGSDRNRVPGTSESRGDGDLVIQRQELDGERRMLRVLVARLQDWASGKREALRAAAAVPLIAGNLEVARLYSQLVQYETTHDSLTRGHWGIAPTHPDVQRMNELVTITEKRLVPVVRGALQARASALDVSIAALDDLRARRASSYQRLSTTEAEEARLLEQVENGSRSVEQLQAEQQKARIAEAVEVGQVEIVDAAPLPTGPVGVGPERKLVFGLLLGLLLGGIGASVADHLNRSISGHKDVTGLGLPVLGLIPHMGAPGNGARKTRTATAVMEALRGIRLNLSHAYGSAGPLLVTVTSPGTREGKSFIASNLALAFAGASHNTLLIDGDLRRGGLDRLLNVARKPGLADFLRGDATDDQILHATQYQSLSFVPSGARSADAAELLGSPAMSQFVSGLRSQFAVIIVDSPPLGAAVDAFALATMTGNLLMVLRLGATDREVAEAKLDLLARLPVRILGAVLNDVPKGPLYRPYAYHIEGYGAENQKGKGARILRGD